MKDEIQTLHPVDKSALRDDEVIPVGVGGERFTKVKHIRAAIGAIPDAEWEFASEVKRDHPLIAQLAGALEFGAEDVDEVFRKAKAIGD